MTWKQTGKWSGGSDLPLGGDLSGTTAEATVATVGGVAAAALAAQLPTADEAAALAGTGTPSGSNKYVTNDDSRLSDARTPTGAIASGDLAGSNYPNPLVATVGGVAAAAIAAQLPSSAEKTALAYVTSLAAVGSGMLAKTSSGNVASRTIASADGSVTVTNGDGVAASPDLAVSSDLGIFGDGSDGTATIGAGTTFLSRDMFYQDLTVNGTLITSGFRLFVRGTLAIGAGGVIQFNGAGASGATGGAALSTGGTLNFAAAAGASGRSTTGVGTVGGANANPGLGGSGGAGGADSTGNAGGASGGQSSLASIDVPPRSLPHALWHGRANRTVALNLMGTGGGGGSGACNVGTGTATSGGGGGSGGWVTVACRILNNAGVISANGGAGAAASGATGTGKAGGGGGGGGGLVILVYRRLVALGTVTASGGAAGAGVGGGIVGQAGSDGTVITLAVA